MQLLDEEVRGGCWQESGGSHRYFRISRHTPPHSLNRVRAQNSGTSSNTCPPHQCQERSEGIEECGPRFRDQDDGPTNFAIRVGWRGNGGKDLLVEKGRALLFAKHDIDKDRFVCNVARFRRWNIDKKARRFPKRLPVFILKSPQNRMKPVSRYSETTKQFITLEPKDDIPKFLGVIRRDGVGAE